MLATWAERFPKELHAIFDIAEIFDGGKARTNGIRRDRIGKALAHEVPHKALEGITFWNGLACQQGCRTSAVIFDREERFRVPL